MAREQKLSSSEKIILSAIYDYTQTQLKKPNLNDITEVANSKYGKNWKIQTVATFLKRIDLKGFIRAEKIGRFHYYEGIYTKEMLLEKELLELADIYMNGDMKALADVTVKLSGK